MAKLGFIGVGTMGASFARNLQKAGFELVIHDVNKDAAASHLAAGATWAESPHALATQVDTVLLSLPGPAEVAATKKPGLVTRLMDSNTSPEGQIPAARRRVSGVQRPRFCFMYWKNSLSGERISTSSLASKLSRYACRLR